MTFSVAQDVKAHETAGVLSYAGALQTLEQAAAQPMTAALFAQLVSVARSLNAGGVASAYVAQMFQDVVLGNSANATWNGGSDDAIRLGNLSASSSTAQFDALIDKWFLGEDLPGVEMPWDDYPSTYENYSLPLFSPGGPKITDVAQGQDGDCWFLAALAETALLRPSLIENLIKPNGNGTYSVEFQVNGRADYVTVNSELPTYLGGLGQFDGSPMAFANSTSTLWAPLIEKALAQLSGQSGVQTGEEYASGANQYYELDGGGAEGMSLLTGQTTTTFAAAGRSSASLTSLLGSLAALLGAGQDVLLGTSEQPITGGDLIADHMFAVTAINAATGMVSLYNPWGANASGAGAVENFSVSATAIASDHADFFAARGAVHA